MGTTLLVFRLAARDVRRHVAQAALLVVAIAAATATLTMALALNGVTSQPYAATRAATKGPDVVANLTSVLQAKGLIHAAGVTASSGPYPVATATIRFDGRTAEVFAEGRDTTPAAVDQPPSTLLGRLGAPPEAAWSLSALSPRRSGSRPASGSP